MASAQTGWLAGAFAVARQSRARRGGRNPLDSSSDSDDATMQNFNTNVPARVNPRSEQVVRWWLLELRRKMAEEGGSPGDDDVDEDSDSSDLSDSGSPG